MNYVLKIAYDGTAYHGWQRQKNGITVQEVMESTLEKLLGAPTAVTGCSRTDAGVHARIYVCNFHGETSIPEEKLPIVLNMYLPPDIRVYDCKSADEDFNARFSAHGKIYEYKILNRAYADPIQRNFVWHYPIKLDVEKMRLAAAAMRGKHDFACFCAAGSRVKSTVRNLYELSVHKEGDIITVRAGADGFLYNMVRIITGTLVYVGNGKLTAEEISELMKKGDRRLAGITAPPQGLALTEVFYE